MKEIRKVEKSFGKVGKNNEPWAIALYDFCNERISQVLEMCLKCDMDANGTASKDDFVEGLQNMGAPIPEENDLKKTLQAHDKNKDNTVDYNDFLTGKKYINKLFLMSAFEGKKKKKKGGKKGKKGKTKIAMEIPMQPDGQRAEDGGPPEMFVARHIHYTDTGRFDRDAPPSHPLQDDSAWYLHPPEKSYININEAVKHGDKDTLRDAFNMGVSIDIKDKYYKTPLMVACAYGDYDMVKFLTEYGASVHAVDSFKWTALHFACHAGMKDIAEYLLEKGANLEAVTVNGGTPLMRAIESSKPDLVEFLIKKGAKLQVENAKGQNPMDLAGAWGDLRVYELIRTKWDSMPPMNDKNKKGGGKGTSGGKSSSAGDASKPSGGGRSMSPTDALMRQRKGSILRAASALAGGIEEREDITYSPRKTWTKQATTEELICERHNRRNRYGWEVDFPDFKMPFLKNADNKVIEMGGPDSDDDE